MGRDPGLMFTTKGCHLLAIWLLATCVASNNVNEPPIFEPGGFPLGLPLNESTEVGTEIFTLKGHDPEGSPVKYGIQSTDKLTVDPSSGVITLAKPLDREENDTVRFLVSLEDKVTEGQQPNIVGVDAYVILLDVNDNPPKFSGTPYEAMADEDTQIGTTILPGIRVTDPDFIGENIEVSCVSQPQFPDACAKFGIVDVEKSQNTYVGALVLRQPLDYKQRPFYQLLLRASDGVNVETTGVEIKVADIQNSPPEFLDSLNGIVKENDQIGTLVMTVKARDGDRGMPRQILYELESNPFDYFLLDQHSGELRTAKPLDREALKDSTGVLTLKIKAREVVNGIYGNDDSTVSTANATVTIKDVNDESPTFNKREYSIEIPENVPDGTLLPHLDMTVRDPDVGLNSKFSLRLEDITGAFSVEPVTATGSTSVNIRVVNGSLDYENPNQQKFIILVIAEELHTEPKLSSTATVTVTITDANDNAPSFNSPTYAAVVSESSAPGTPVATIRAKDRDSGELGTAGIIYQLLGQGAEHFAVDKRNGSITVAGCPSPGTSPCLDFEEQNEYFLNYKAIDDNGNGQTTTVSLRVSLADANDSPPKFLQDKYRAVIDEGAEKFEPELKVQARDRDKTSKITYSIIDGNEMGFFEINPSTGEISIANNGPIDLTNSTHEWISLIVGATDGLFSDTAMVNVTVRDVNNNDPIFPHDVYTASVPETAPTGTLIEEIYATDADSGINAELKYRIQKGAFDDFVINETTGIVSVSGKLDYDTRNAYHIEVIALDGGTPSLTGTATLMIKIENTNNKAPYFTPNTQRAEITGDSPVGTVFTSVKAVDPDSTSQDALKFSITEPITAIDKNGQLVTGNTTAFKDFFAIDPKTGQVSVVRALDREIAATVSLNVIVTDTSASVVQQGAGTLVVTIIDVNRLPPEFLKPWTKDNPQYMIEMQEEQPTGAIVGAFTATDVDSNISEYTINPPSSYFNIDNVTGIVRTSQIIDYEESKQLEFIVVAYDSGVPQLSSTAKIIVNIINVNDQDPKFQQESYNVTVRENSPAGTHVTIVKATDSDEGVFGEISYSLIGEHASDFNIGHETGEITVGAATVLDREETGEITVTVMASDGGPIKSRRSTTVPVVIHLEDVNDNKPVFTQHSYRASVAENLSINPPATILQVRAEDDDDDVNGKVSYTIVSGNEDGAFSLNEETGFLYPAMSLAGRAGTYRIQVEARDGQGGKGPHSDKAYVDIRVIAVNQHKPEFVMPELPNATVQVPENAGIPNYLVMRVRATDEDPGENGRISYFVKVGNRNVPETDEFMIDQESGELRAKIILDREVKSKFELVLVATDHGNPTNYETLRLLTIVLVDTNDNIPEFYEEYSFHVAENRPKDSVVGRVAAEDKDEGRHARVYYYIAGGNDNTSFYIDKSDGTIYTNKSFDRETRDNYVLSIVAANDPDLYIAPSEPGKSLTFNPEHGYVNVTISILDENDSPPVFERSDYYTGINSMANVNDIVAKVTAYDQDVGENGTLHYYVASANLYKYGSDKPSGSIVPSPFNVSQDGKLRTSGYMAEYNQDRFIVEIVAKETASPERFAMARVHVWVFEPSQLIRVILSRPPDEVHRQRDEIVAELSNATQSRVVVDEIRYHVDSAGKIRREWCDMYLHVVDPKNQNITPVPQVLRAIDAKYDILKDYYIGFAIENVVPAFAGRQEAPFDPALAALIALLVVLLVGAVTVTVVCCCLRHWVITVPSDIRKKDGLIKKQIIDELNTTENPLWIEQKLKLYEEQELTMQVFSEPEGALVSERRGSGVSVGMDTSQDNTYATIQHPAPANRHRPTTPDYTTLPGNHSLYESAMGFQGSTFQPSTTVVPQLTLDRDGQPQFVSGLV